jgi:hypothetical protein
MLTKDQFSIGIPHQERFSALCRWGFGTQKFQISTKAD